MLVGKVKLAVIGKHPVSVKCRPNKFITFPCICRYHPFLRKYLQLNRITVNRVLILCVFVYAVRIRNIRIISFFAEILQYYVFIIRKINSKNITVVFCKRIVL